MIDPIKDSFLRKLFVPEYEWQNSSVKSRIVSLVIAIVVSAAIMYAMQPDLLEHIRSL